MPEVFLKTMTGGTITLEFDHTDTIECLIGKLQRLHPHLCPEGKCLHMVFAGQSMDESRTLADYSVTTGSMLHVIPKAAPKEPASKARALCKSPTLDLEQSVDTGNCFVFCQGQHDGKGPDGEELPDLRWRVCPCSFKLRCTSCGAECIELPAGKEMQDLCPTTASLLKCMRSKARIPGTVCHNYDTEKHDGGPGMAGVDCGAIYVACKGPRADGHVCHAASHLNECSLLPQVVAAGPGDKCCVSSEAPDDGKLVRFDPCGHTMSLHWFIEHARQEIRSGLGSEKLVKSHVTGHHAFACPMKGEKCARSLVHDLHHYKMLGVDEQGKKYYDRIKELAVEQYKPEPPQPLKTPGCSPVMEKIHEAILEAQFFQCPQCPFRGVKDGGCMFINCPSPKCGHEFCYWCGCPSKDHTCPRNCRPIFLTEAMLSTGFEFSENGRVALQEYTMWRLKWLLRKVYDKVGRRAFETAVASEPHVLQDLYADDGTGELGVDGALAGVVIKVDDIINYERVSVVGKFSQDERCDPFPYGPPRGWWWW